MEAAYFAGVRYLFCTEVVADVVGLELASCGVGWGGVGRTVLQCGTTRLHCMRGTFPDFAGEEAFAVVVVVGFLFFFNDF